MEESALNSEISKVSSQTTTKSRARPISFISDRKRRNTTFSKRKKSIISKTYEISRITGCSVFLSIKSGKNVYCYGTNEFGEDIAQLGTSFAETAIPKQPSNVHVTLFDEERGAVRHLPVREGMRIPNTNLVNNNMVSDAEAEDSSSAVPTRPRYAHPAMPTRPALTCQKLPCMLSREPTATTIITETPPVTGPVLGSFDTMSRSSKLWARSMAAAYLGAPPLEADEQLTPAAEWLDDSENENDDSAMDEEAVAAMALMGDDNSSDSDDDMHGSAISRRVVPEQLLWAPRDDDEEGGVNSLVYSRFGR
ncbi:hypothetical protein J8273_3374 [Carpediemonas membranifera]|uniref:MADS-box domain-containing protein n=1 Tax=Carpediemonas membranifera TaxID=201153 RepID=A0A8J6ASD4_9EUKA|nr:hypothetical protein J8273_3374 [Carpediemonas membranifera]|eukprot:KAG9393241.1 hypothetical protein J8273_3374 [Carpediemonas membranifera]